MRVVIAPDKFKGTLSAEDVAKAVDRGIRRVLPETNTIIAPMADGGEGTVDAIIAASGGARHGIIATGPLGAPVKAGYAALNNKTAIIEMAQSSGLVLVPSDKRDPTITTTFGTGEVIEAALDLGCERFIIGIGGSATCDGGIGVAKALGVKIYKGDGSEVGPGGRELIKIASIDTSAIDPRVKGKKFLVAADVKNPLYGPLGAAHMFAPQKGASADQVILLDQGLINLARVIKRDLGIDISDIPGAGAAGGLGGGLVAFLGAKIEPGVELIADTIGLREKIKGADLVITGEGRIDVQTAYGKVPAGVAWYAASSSVATVAIAGSLGEGYDRILEEGIEKIYPLTEFALSIEEAMRNPSHYIEMAASQVALDFLFKKS